MKQKILDTIKKFDTIIIHRHVRPDPDAYGSQCGLGELLKASFPNKEVYMVGKEDESLNFLKRLDQIEDDKYKDALVIVCDTANQERICDERYKLGKYLIKIDHHPNIDQYGDLVWVDTSASSVSEMIYEFYLHGNEQGLTLTKEAARLIYAGIVGDTGRFLFPSTTEKTFRYASELITYGFDFTEIYHEMYKTKRNVANLSGYILQNFTMTETGVAHIVLDKQILQKFHVTARETSQLVGILGDIEGVKVWVFFIEEEDQIRVRFRSKGPIINEIAQKYNGGGHPLASGASIYDWDKVQNILTDLEKACH